MVSEGPISTTSELEFASGIDSLSADSARRASLTDFLREDHPVYAQRSAASVVRMRGWVLLALARAPLPDDAQLFVLEELESGTTPYLAAAAARALRSCPQPHPAFAQFLVRALGNIHARNEPVALEHYGEYALSPVAATSPMRELLATLAWLGPQAADVAPDLAVLRRQIKLPKHLAADFDHALSAISGTRDAAPRDCCSAPIDPGYRISSLWRDRRTTRAIEAISLEDHKGETTRFGAFFRGQPSIVAFFYTRCDNPFKCSLTVTKLARIQRMLAERGLSDKIQTAAITYDPGFDLPLRLASYARDRGLQLGPHHRLFRTPEGISALRDHFQLGVNFVSSLVNRHRIELYILDAQGRVAASFERIIWDEKEVFARALAIADEPAAVTENRAKESRFAAWRRFMTSAVGTTASLGAVLLPKCPMCGAAYLGAFGVAGLDTLPDSPWFEPLLFGVMSVNLVAVGLRSRITGRLSAFYLVLTGALAILASRLGQLEGPIGLVGLILVFIGSMLSTLQHRGVTTIRRPLWHRLHS